MNDAMKQLNIPLAFISKYSVDQDGWREGGDSPTILCTFLSKNTTTIAFIVDTAFQSCSVIEDYKGTQKSSITQHIKLMFQVETIN